MAVREEITKLLISKGADLNVRVTFGPHKGKIPLDGFVGSNDGKQTEFAALLRKHRGKNWQELKAEGAKYCHCSSSSRNGFKSSSTNTFGLIFC